MMQRNGYKFNDAGQLVRIGKKDKCERYIDTIHKQLTTGNSKKSDTKPNYKHLTRDEFNQLWEYIKDEDGVRYVDDLIAKKLKKGG